MSKIEALTEEQKARLKVYRDRWIKIGLCTDTFTLSEVRKDYS